VPDAARVFLEQGDDDASTGRLAGWAGPSRRIKLAADGVGDVHA
jgi:hypothetical protein